MKKKYFGTDGIRGQVGVIPITPDFVMRIGHAFGCILIKDKFSLDKPTVLVGKDTRVSGHILESALKVGFSAAGVDVIVLDDPMPDRKSVV